MCLSSIEIALVNYIKTIQDAVSAKKNNSKVLSDIIDNGFILTDLSKAANSVYGKLLAIEYLFIIFGSIFGMFISLNIFKAFSTFEPGLFLTCTCGICNLTLYAIKLFYYIRVGQNLCEAYAEVHDELGKLLMSDGIFDKQRRELEFVVSRFSIRSPIRPLDMYDMNYANLAVLSSIMFTYNIILMQFKGY